jgi:hypothetical protein
MGILHDLEAMAESPMVGMQAQQRDWSPFVAHFTSATAMDSLRHAIKDRLEPHHVKARLTVADSTSFKVLTQILQSGLLRASPPPGGSRASLRVSLSECTLPGLISHAERFGRCGLLFRKDVIFSLGGRPCVYVAADVYDELKQGKGESESRKILFDLANVYRPAGFGRTQDFTHEREWRVTTDINLRSTPPLAVIVPGIEYMRQLPASVRDSTPVIPLTLLHRWGV